MYDWDGEPIETDATDPDFAIQMIYEVVAPLSRTQMTSVAVGTLLIDEQWRPWWVFVIAVFFFPIGLIALLHKKYARLVVVAEGEPDEKVTVRVSGTASNAVTNAMWRTLGDVLSD